MSFVKLDCGMLDSTLWADPDATRIFITALLMARPRQFMEPCQQIEVRTLELTGFTLPPGWYGFVAAAGPGIVRRSEMEMEAGMAALERLGHPEMESRTPDHGGRRLVRIDGGYVALNFQNYRDKDHTAAERSKRWRRKKSKSQKQVRAQNESRERRYVAADAAGDANGADMVAAEGLPGALT